MGFIQSKSNEKFQEISQIVCCRKWLEMENTLPILMDDLWCRKYDASISDCRARLISHNCDHNRDIWLQCKGKLRKRERHQLNVKHQNNWILLVAFSALRKSNQ